MISASSTYIDRWTNITIKSVSSVLLVATLTSLLINLPFLYMMLAITLVAALPFILRIEPLICLLTFYIIAFENILFKGMLVPIHLQYLFIDGAMVVLLVLLLIDLSLYTKTDRQQLSFAKPFLVFFAAVATATIVGIINGNQTQAIYLELRILLYYLTYFIAARVFKDMRWIKMFAIAVLLGTLVASFDAIYTFQTSNLLRFVSRQIHILMLVTPFLVSALILDRVLLRKLAYFSMLVPIGLAVLISQTRGTWVAILIAIFLAIVLSIFTNSKRGRRFLSLTVTTLALLTILVFGLRFLGSVSSVKKEAVETRAETVSNLALDNSLAMRIHAYLTVMVRIKQSPWIGHGLGDTVVYGFWNQYSRQANVDSTYLTILWKMGVIGLIPFALLYFLLLKRTFAIYRTEEDDFRRTISIGVLAAFLGFLVLGTISPVLFTYRLNFIFGVIFAIVDILARNSDKRSFRNYLTKYGNPKQAK